MCANDTTVECPEAAVLRVPLHALDGSNCGLACELCALRAWKSRNMTSPYCVDVLEQHRRKIEALCAVNGLMPAEVSRQNGMQPSLTNSGN